MEYDKDKSRLTGLRKLAGYVEDGSSETITIRQDDATNAWIVRVGKQWWHGASFRAAIDAAIAGTETAQE